MSRLEELIEKYCPNGVEYKTIVECTLKTTNIKWKQETRSLQYIDLTSVDRDTHRITETTVVNKENAPSRAQQIVQTGDIIFGGTRPMLKRYCLIPEEYDGQVCSTGFCVLRPDNNIILTNWLYHHISSSAFYSHVEMYQKGASYPAISDAEVKMFSIPVPPLPVQEEIVRILDNFTQLTAELQARKKQYEYYRDLLLTFSDSSSQSVNVERADRQHAVEWFELKKVANLFRGEYITKKDTTPGSIPVVLGGQEPAYYIDDYNHVGKIVTVARSGASAGFVSYWDEPIFVTDGFGFEAKEIIDIRFLFYILKNMQPQLNGMKRGAGVPHISGEALLNILIPVPSLAEQARIVSILDRFDALCNDITAGLPAEIEARQKQYEYYRDKLLTFQERTNAN